MASTKLEVRENYLFLHLDGDYIGGEETDKLRETLKDLSHHERKDMIIDLTNVVYMASPTLGVLLSANAQFHKKKGKVVLFHANEYLANIFSITKLNMIFPICATLEEAEAELGL